MNIEIGVEDLVTVEDEGYDGYYVQDLEDWYGNRERLNRLAVQLATGSTSEILVRPKEEVMEEILQRALGEEAYKVYRNTKDQLTQEAEKRSAAAKRGWEKRRANVKSGTKS